MSITPPLGTVDITLESVLADRYISSQYHAMLARRRWAKSTPEQRKAAYDNMLRGKKRASIPLGTAGDGKPNGGLECLKEKPS